MTVEHPSQLSESYLSKLAYRKRLDQLSNPVEQCLNALNAASDSGSMSELSIALKTYVKWLKAEQNMEFHLSHLDSEAMNEAFDLFMSKFSHSPCKSDRDRLVTRWHHLERFTTIFSDFKALSTDIVDYVKDLLDENDFYSAAHFIGVARLQNQFPNILVRVLQPAYLQRRNITPTLKAILYNRPDLREGFMNWLMGLFGFFASFDFAISQPIMEQC
ncbi:hypothetical protein QR680_015421 [Steinernema hermaphroditum]|uniref:Uncharacterized protein n=1 Tax=Steinernema hermaphroditum TaxID=289476 RepID=A0AA39LKN6_9BILA|nr:hypothetical protein QR680_015421 [Steinernema hermaphroditum]